MGHHPHVRSLAGTFAPRLAAGFAVGLAALASASDAGAQVPPQQGGWTAQGGYQGGYPGTYPGGGYAPAPIYPQPVQPATTSSNGATPLEMGTLYVFSAAYGVGTGVWLDAELKIDDPGLQFLPPGILGVGVPIGVYFLDRFSPMQRGMPAAISAGMAIGAGEGVGIASYQFTRATAANEWGFRGFARSVFFGSTAGAVAGYAAAVGMEPSPKTSLLLGSSVAWGTVIGSMLGYGGTEADSSFGDANDKASLGGLIGYNAGLLGAAALSMVYVPTYKSIAWMWIGFGAGIGISTPVYLFYAGGEHDPRRGLIFQGTAATLGLLAGAVFSMDAPDYAENTPSDRTPGFLRVTGAAPMAVPGGLGVSVSGLLF